MITTQKPTTTQVTRIGRKELVRVRGSLSFPNGAIPAIPLKWPYVLAIYQSDGTPVEREEGTRLVREIYYNQPLEFQVAEATGYSAGAGVSSFNLTMLMKKSAGGHWLLVQDRVWSSTLRVTRERVFRACMSRNEVAGLNVFDPGAWRLLVGKTGTCMLPADSLENWNRIIYCAKDE